MSTRIAMSSLRFGRWKSIKPILASRGNFYQIFVIFLPAATKLGQGNIFTSVCLSTGGEGCLPQCMLGYTPPDQAPPGPGTTPLRSRHPPWTRHHQAPPPPRTRHHHHPPLQAPPPPPGSRHTPPPRKQTSAYGQRAAGTHPTGMHSCSTEFCSTKPANR